MKMWNLKLLSVLQNRFTSLAIREKTAIFAGVVVIVVFLFFQFGYFPMSDRIDRLQLDTKSREKDLSELKRIVAQHKRLSATQNTIGNRKQDFNLFSELEKIARKSGVMDNLINMKPGTQMLDSVREENLVEVKLDKLTLKELTGYLYNLFTLGEEIYIKRLSARKDGEYLDLILQPAIVAEKK